MIVIKTSIQLTETVKKIQSKNKRIGFVPTMGNLHQGHLDLINIAGNNADSVIVSIFVNPLQFSQQYDLEHYPRTIEQDLIHCEESTVDYVFVPSVKEIYSDNNRNDRIEFSELSNLSEILEGQSRPNHFAGVITVINKFFSLIHPDVVVFGEKDYQQFLIIKNMIRLSNLPIEMISSMTTREQDGLAMSSRNSRLSDKERKLAPKLFEILQFVAHQITSGNRRFKELSQAAVTQLSDLGFKTDYFEIRNADDLSLADEDCSVIILLAVYLGGTRLIDNIRI